MTQENSVAVLLVCLGNICRSPSAHGVLRDRVAAAGLDQVVMIESAGTGDWHVGKPPDDRAVAAAAGRGIDIAGLRARQICADDLCRFDYVLAMDEANLRDLQQLARVTSGARADIALFGDYSERYRGEAVPDPYFGGDSGFDQVLDRVEDAADGVLAMLRKRLSQRG